VRAIILGAKVSTKRSNYRHKGRGAEAKYMQLKSERPPFLQLSSFSALAVSKKAAVRVCVHRFQHHFLLLFFARSRCFIFSRGLFSFPSNELSQFALLWPAASYYISRQEIQNTPRYELYF